MHDLTPRQFAEAAIELFKDFPARYQRANSDLTDRRKRMLQNHYAELMPAFRFGDPDSLTHLNNQLQQQGRWARRNAVWLHEPVACGIGYQAIVYKLQDMCFRTSPKPVYRFVHPYVLPSLNTTHDPLTGLTTEALTLLNFSNNTEEDVDHLRVVAAQTGLDYQDWSIYNQAPYQAPNWDTPHHVITDPGCAKPLKLKM